MKQTELNYDVVFNTNIATIGLAFEGESLTRLAYLPTSKNKSANNKQESRKQFDTVKQTITKYLAGSSKVKIQDIAIKLYASDFRARVLQQLQNIPYGETRSYGEIAKQLKTSPRAVGNACRNNPLPIIIPCHRVVAANGIGGYDGAVLGKKLDIKSHLLQLEGVL